MSIKIKENKSHILKTSGKYCECDIVIEPVVETSDVLGTVVPKIEDQNIYPDEGYVGIGSVHIKGVTSDIDEDIKPENIKKGVEILGVKGIYTNADDPNLKPENIKNGVTIYDVEGTYTPSDPNLTPENIKDGVIIHDIKGTYKPNDPDLLPENIAYGVNIFGVTGGLTAGTPNLRYSYTNTSNPYGNRYDANCTGFIDGTNYSSKVVIGSCCETNWNYEEYYPGIVTGVSSSAFKNKTKITDLIISEGISSIGSEAFYGCTGLKEVFFPNSLSSIGASAFLDCNSLISIKLPNKLVSIGRATFASCDNLKEVDISSFESPTNLGDPYPSIGVDAFNTNLSNLEILIPSKYYNDWIEYSNWNDYVKYIYVVDGDGNKFTPGLKTSFELINGQKVNKLTGYGTATTYKLYIPATVSHIEDNAFKNNETIKEVIIPNSITNIGSYAFYGMSSLSEVRFLDFSDGSLPWISSSAFDKPTGERKAVLPSEYINEFKNRYGSYGWFTSYEAL